MRLPMRLNLFWRTFVLLAIASLLSVTVTIQMFHWLDETPTEQQIAWELASVVNLTRNAVVSSSGEKRQNLLGRLAREERARLSPLETTDTVELMSGLLGSLNYTLLSERLKDLLGPNTNLAGKVNGQRGLWISFEIDSDAYWLILDAERLSRHNAPPIMTITLIALALSMVATMAVGRLINQPLRNLASALNRLGAGQAPPKLSEDGPTEIAVLNRRFNRMAVDLNALEEDRRIALAGISHDIRSPLARLRMEIELSPLEIESKASMAMEIEQVDRIVGQFVDFARSHDNSTATSITVADVIQKALTRYSSELESSQLKLNVQIDSALQWKGREIDLERVISNVIDNALRYGRSEDQVCRIELKAESLSKDPADSKRIRLIIKDSGKGVAAKDLTRLTRPFARVDEARDSSGGSGLGLAIVERTAQKYDGKCLLSLNVPHGLVVDLRL
jgi:two-component system, OmpR family, osmolarity sensor histidine kinase EnvZ